VKLYLKYGRRLKATICELGCPTKNSLKAWCAEFGEAGNLQEKYVRSLPNTRMSRKIEKLLSAALAADEKGS
jgi:hypothetical protein